MARGWESKSVEDQQAESAKTPDKNRPRLTAEEAVKKRRQDELGLARKNLLQQLQAAQNPRLRQMLQDALAELDTRLRQLG